MKPDAFTLLNSLVGMFGYKIHIFKYIDGKYAVKIGNDVLKIIHVMTGNTINGACENLLMSLKKTDFIKSLPYVPAVPWLNYDNLQDLEVQLVLAGRLNQQVSD